MYQILPLDINPSSFSFSRQTTENVHTDKNLFHSICVYVDMCSMVYVSHFCIKKNNYSKTNSEFIFILTFYFFYFLKSFRMLFFVVFVAIYYHYPLYLKVF